MNGQSKILVVDDEEVVRRSHLRLLRKGDCNVETASTGTDALREMERVSFDLVLLDLDMPGMDGMSVLKTIKQKWPESEVVVITGFPTIDSVKEAISLGAYDYLAKPVYPEQVIQVAHKRWALYQVNEPQTQALCA